MMDVWWVESGNVSGRVVGGEQQSEWTCGG